MRKQAEREFATLCAHYHIWAHKWRDVSRCPHCGKLLFVTKRNTSGESIVDYLAFINDLPIWVECKGGLSTNRFDFADLKEHQRRFMNSWTQRKVGCWLFLLMGSEKAPNREAWLIPWSLYTVAENALFLRGKKSFSMEDMESFFYYCKLVWHDGQWIIPTPASAFTDMYPQVHDLPELR